MDGFAGTRKIRHLSVIPLSKIAPPTLSLKQTSRVLNGDVIIDFNAAFGANEHYVYYDDALSDSAYVQVLLRTRPGWRRTRILTDAALVFTSQALDSQIFHECANSSVLLNHLPSEANLTSYYKLY